MHFNKYAWQVKTYSNLNGLFAVTEAALPLLDSLHAAISRVKMEKAPAYD